MIIDSTSAAAYEQEFAGELTVGITGLSSNPLAKFFRKEVTWSILSVKV